MAIFRLKRAVVGILLPGVSARDWFGRGSMARCFVSQSARDTVALAKRWWDYVRVGMFAACVKSICLRRV